MEKCYLEKIPHDKSKTNNFIYKVGYFFILCISLQSDFLQLSSVNLIKGAANFQTDSLWKSNPAYYIKRRAFSGSKFTQVK